MSKKNVSANFLKQFVYDYTIREFSNCDGISMNVTAAALLQVEHVFT